MENLRMALGVLLLIGSLSLPAIEDVVDNTPSVRSALAMEEPAPELVEIVEQYDYVTDEKDREKLALVTFEFANRIQNYETTGEKLQDVYKDAFEELFGTQMKGKYKDFSELIGRKALESVIGDNDVFVKDDKKDSLSKRFYAVAWVLGE